MSMMFKCAKISVRENIGFYSTRCFNCPLSAESYGCFCFRELTNQRTVVLTDFSKAFDLVNHSVAIQKLIHLGVRGTIVPWICSFLYGRKQCVRYNQTLSDFFAFVCWCSPRHQTWPHSLPGSHQWCCCGWHSPLLEICGWSYVRRKSAFQWAEQPTGGSWWLPWLVCY